MHEMPVGFSNHTLNTIFGRQYSLTSCVETPKIFLLFIKDENTCKKSKLNFIPDWTKEGKLADQPMQKPISLRIHI
jgi:hypothetical protein